MHFAAGCCSESGNRRSFLIIRQGKREIQNLPFAAWLPVLLRIFCGRDVVDTPSEIEKSICRKMHQWFGEEYKMRLPLLSLVFGLVIGECNQSREHSMLLAKEREMRVCSLLSAILKEYSQPGSPVKPRLSTSTQDDNASVILGREASMRLTPNVSKSFLESCPSSASQLFYESESEGEGSSQPVQRLKRSSSVTSTSSVTSISSTASSAFGGGGGRKRGPRVKRCLVLLHPRPSCPPSPSSTRRPASFLWMCAW